MRDYFVSSCVKLHVNYADLPFNADHDENVAQRVTDRISEALGQAGDAYAYLLPSGMQEDTAIKLKRRYLMDADTKEAPYSVLYLRMDEALSVQTALSDHAVISARCAGDNMLKALEEARRVRQQLAKTGLLARDEEYGYLTAYPCDAGTGMRASAVLHLPMMHLARQTEKMIKILGEKGMILRPYSGEIGKVLGGLYVIENRAALGKPAQERSQDVIDCAQKICAAERRCREEVRQKEDVAVYDAIWRAYGIAKFARRLNMADTLNLWSSLTLGVSLGAFEVSEELLHDLWELSEGKRPGEADEMGNPDILRAQRVRFLLNGGN